MDEQATPQQQPAKEGWRDLFSGVVREGRKVVESEAIQAQREWQAKAGISKQTAIMLAGVLVAALVGLFLVSICLALLIGTLLGNIAGFAIVGLLWVGAAVSGGLYTQSYYNREEAKLEAEKAAATGS